MRQLLITAVALTAVLVYGMTLNVGRARSSIMAAESPQLEAGIRAYCSKSRALIGQAYFATHDKTCRTARRLLA